MADLVGFGQTLRKNKAVLHMVLLGLGIAVLFPLWQVVVVHPGARAVLISIVEIEAERLARHLGTPLRARPDLLNGAPLPDDFIAETAVVARDFGIEKMKLFAADGTVLWVSDGVGVGERNTHAYFHEIVALGQPYSKLARKRTPSLEGRMLSRDVVETYVPITVEGGFRGAFEIYSDVTPHMVSLEVESWRNTLVLGGLSAVPLLLLALVTRHAVAAMALRDSAHDDLRESEARFRSIANSAQDAIIEMDHDGRIAFWNPAAERIFGLGLARAIGQDLHRLVAPERFLGSFQMAFRRFQSSGEGSFLGRVIEVVGRRADGGELPVEVSIAALGGRQGHSIGIVRDISERKEAEQRLKLGARVMDFAMNGIIVTDVTGRIELVNPAFTRLTGYTLTDVVGQKPNILKSGRHGPEFYTALWADLNGKGEWQGEIWNRRRNGEVFPEWLCLTAITDSRGCVTHYLAIFSDISQRKEAERDLERLAFYDPLTGIANRVLFRERVTQVVRETRRYPGNAAVFYLDLDLFKQVNDTWGHEYGDLLLQQVAQRLQTLVRTVDTVARLGGDEFAIVARNVPNQTAAAAIAAKIVSSLAEPFDLDGRHCQIGSSIGVALFPEHGTDGDTLVRRADEAMYEAKRGGRNQYRVCVAREQAVGAEG
ncbi:MAG: diguanylate cyclase [Alphaproteobacteria bacterium]|nr:diguanylate cyclase [Alphaproteobacteria bacterium]